MYMLAMTALSMVLTLLEALYMTFHMTRKGVSRRAEHAAEKRNRSMMEGDKERRNQGIYAGYDASNFQSENMMTMRSNRGIKSTLAANSLRNGRGGL